jgi:hypothetical protein
VLTRALACVLAAGLAAVLLLLAGGQQARWRAAVRAG